MSPAKLAAHETFTDYIHLTHPEKRRKERNRKEKKKRKTPESKLEVKIITAFLASVAGG